jgi:hypothetical protein
VTTSVVHRSGRREDRLRNAGVPNAVDFDNTDKVMRFDVRLPLAGPDTSRVPTVLDTTGAFSALKESDARGPRHDVPVPGGRSG